MGGDDQWLGGGDRSEEHGPDGVRVAPRPGDGGAGVPRHGRRGDAEELGAPGQERQGTCVWGPGPPGREVLLTGLGSATTTIGVSHSKFVAYFRHDRYRIRHSDIHSRSGNV